MLHLHFRGSISVGMLVLHLIQQNSVIFTDKIKYWYQRPISRDLSRSPIVTTT